MGCRNCGKKTAKSKKVGEIQTWIESLGTWKYIGLCPCPGKMKMFVSDHIRGWAIYISQAGGTMEVRQIIGIDHKVRAIGVLSNYKSIYNHYIKCTTLK